MAAYGEFLGMPLDTGEDYLLVERAKPLLAYADRCERDLLVSEARRLTAAAAEFRRADARVATMRTQLGASRRSSSRASKPTQSELERVWNAQQGHYAHKMVGGPSTAGYLRAVGLH